MPFFPGWAWRQPRPDAKGNVSLWNPLSVHRASCRPEPAHQRSGPLESRSFHRPLREPLNNMAVCLLPQIKEVKQRRPTTRKDLSRHLLESLTISHTHRSYCVDRKHYTGFGLCFFRNLTSEGNTKFHLTPDFKNKVQRHQKRTRQNQDQKRAKFSTDFSPMHSIGREPEQNNSVFFMFNGGGGSWPGRRNWP